MTGKRVRPAWDVIVAGAGPAGSATAALLAERGVSVALIERATFPRPKPCAEYLSPEATRVLDRLGALRAIDGERPAGLTGMRVVSPSGIAFTGRFSAAHGYRAFGDAGLALPREILDTHLARAAVARGANLVEATTVEDLSCLAGGVHVRVRRGGNHEVLRARCVIGADGLSSRVARILGLARRRRRRRLALVTHARDVLGMTDVGEMHVGRAGYVGLAHVGDGVVNISVVVDLDRARPRPPLERWLRAFIATLPEVDRRLRGARLVGPIASVGPFARWSTRATAERALLVGDAADFQDPFTGEGIYAALRGAELAAELLLPALASDTLNADDLRGYDRARHRTFRGKWTLERVVSAAIARPALFDWVARGLSRHRDLADLLVGVTGDFVPARALLRPSVLWRLAW